VTIRFANRREPSVFCRRSLEESYGLDDAG
jgi:hypothetical protein